MHKLQQITTQYIDREDRIRITGKVSDEDTTVMWLTNKLLNRMVPHLTSWLASKKTTKEIAQEASKNIMNQQLIQSFAQEVAQAQLKAEKNTAVSSSHLGWLVDEVDITMSDTALRLIFKGEEQAEIIMSDQPLRQWLDILFNQYKRGGWPVAAWPLWMQQHSANTPRGDGRNTMH